MKKKLIALLCATVTILSTVACGAADKEVSKESTSSTPVSSEAEKETPSVEATPEPKEPVTIVYWYRNAVGVQEYTDEVQAELNKILAANEETAHITLELHPCKDYATDFALAQASKQQVDIVSIPSLSYETEVANGSFMPLDDLIAQYPEATEEYPEWLMKTGVIDGTTWYIPNYQQASNIYYFCAPKEYLDMAGITAEELEDLFWVEENRTVENVSAMYEELLLAVRKATGKDTKWINGTKLTDAYAWSHNSQTDVQFNHYNNFAWDAEKGEFVFNMLSEDMEKAMMINAEWYEKGYIHPDQATLDGSLYGGKNYLNDESFIFGIEASMSGDTEMASEIFSNNYGMEMVAVPFYGYYYVPASWGARGLAISADCENPDEAMQIISMLTNSKYTDFYNTICWGIEGIHYEKLTDNTIKTLEFDGSQGNADCSYTYWKWAGGNTFNAWCNQSITPEINEFILNEVNDGPKTVTSPFGGFTFDLAALENEKAQMIAVTKEYEGTLRNGTLGVAGTTAKLDEYKEKIEAAGLSKVMEEITKQAKEFLGK